MRLADERWVSMRESVLVLLRGPQHESKPHVEVLLVVLALIGDVRRVVHDDIQGLITEGHFRVVGDHIRVVKNLDIQAQNRPLGAPPEPAAIDRGIQNQLWTLARIKRQHVFQEL